MQLLYPDCRPTSPEELAGRLRLGDKAPPDRPYLVLNMVSSLDGRATIDWLSFNRPMTEWTCSETPLCTSNTTVLDSEVAFSRENSDRRASSSRSWR